MRYALIKNNVVENVILADKNFIKTISSNYDYVRQVTNMPVGPGWSYDSTTKTFKEPTPPSVPTLTLDEAKAQDLARLETYFQEKVKQPILDPANSCSWPGGSETALLIDGAIRLAQQKGATTVDLYDTIGKVHTLAITDAQKVSVLVADAFQSLYAKKMAIAEAINTATTVDEVKKVAIVL